MHVVKVASLRYPHSKHNYCYLCDSSSRNGFGFSSRSSWNSSASACHLHIASEKLMRIFRGNYDATGNTAEGMQAGRQAGTEKEA